MTSRKPKRHLRILVLALPETAGSVLYGLVDVLMSTGSLWQSLVREPVREPPLDVQIASTSLKSFRCGNGIPVSPQVSIGENPSADIIIIPELWLGPDEHLHGRYAASDRRGCASVTGAARISIPSAPDRCCSPRPACWTAAMPPRTGDTRSCSRRRYPKIHFRPEPSLCFADAEGRLVTAGGATSWHDLVLHIISRHVSPGEALRISKVYLLKAHDEGQLPYRALVKPRQHPDSAVRDCEVWLSTHFAQSGAVAGAVRHSKLAERTLKRRFKAATGLTLIEYVQNLRIEKAKQLLETSSTSADEISAEVGYEDASFFRRVFGRRAGLSPARYRRMFQRASRN